MTAPSHRSLRIDDLSLQAHLGWTAEERAHPQEARVSVRIRFAAPLRAESSDDLADSVCYAGVADSLREVAQGREFKLIEKMAADCFAAVRAHLPSGALVAVRVRKVRAPVAGLLGGASYSCGDFEFE